MDAENAVDLGRQALVTGLLLSSPALVVGLVVGLIVSLAQAVTQLHEQTISFVPKLLAIMATLGLCLPWLIEYVMQYTEQVISNIPRMIGGG